MRQAYTQEFKNNVLDYVAKNGALAAKMQFGVSVQSIRNWKAKKEKRQSPLEDDQNIQVVLTLTRKHARDIARQYLTDTLVHDKPI